MYTLLLQILISVCSQYVSYFLVEELSKASMWQVSVEGKDNKEDSLGMKNLKATM